MNKKGVYLFREGNATMRDLLGGKGANLAEMTNIGLPVPPGFVITTEMCNEYSRGTMSWPGYSPPNTNMLMYVPTTGMDSMMPWAMRSPVPDSRSSGSE